MRVGIIALQHESNTFLPARTTLDDFQRGVLVSGDALVRHYAPSHHEVGGFLEGLAAERIEAVPIFAAWATPAGTITAECYQALLDRMLARLDAAGKLDGLLVAPHGAGVSENEPDMDGHWLILLRECVGARIPIICTLDPHANLSPRMVAACDATIAYRTNPHLDQRQRGLESASLMARTLRGQVKPTQAAAFPPVAINIACQETDADPCQTLMQMAEVQRGWGGVLSVSVLFGFPYADVAEVGSAFVLVTDGDPVVAQRHVDDLSTWLVAHRHDFVGQLPPVDDAVKQAMLLDGPVCLLDVGDNVGGGSPADGTIIAHALHARGVRGFVCLCDADASQRAHDAGVGAMLDLDMGGKVDPLHGPPLRATVKVISLHEGRFTETQRRHGGRTGYDMGPTAIVEPESGLTIQLTSRRTPPFSLNQLTSCGIEPQKYQVLVAKGVNAPIAAYKPVCRHIIRVNTPGVTTADMTQLPFQHRRRPMFPFEVIG